MWCRTISYRKFIYVKRYVKKNILKHIDKNPLKKLIRIDDLSDFVFEISNLHVKHLNGSIIDYNGGI